MKEQDVESIIIKHYGKNYWTLEDSWKQNAILAAMKELLNSKADKGVDVVSIKEKEPNWIDLTLSELIEQSLKLGKVPAFSFQNQPKEYWMEQNDLLRKEIERLNAKLSQKPDKDNNSGKGLSFEKWIINNGYSVWYKQEPLYIKDAVDYSTDQLIEKWRLEENPSPDSNLEQEETNHMYTRLAWDRTIEERDNLKIDVKVLTAIKKGLETSLAECLAKLNAATATPTEQELKQ